MHHMLDSIAEEGVDSESYEDHISQFVQSECNAVRRSLLLLPPRYPL
jgi:hypothetical protein